MMFFGPTILLLKRLTVWVGFLAIVGPAMASTLSGWPELPPPQFKAGMSAPDIRQIIAKDLSILSDANVSEELRVVALRKWIHSFLPVGDYRTTLSNTDYDHNGKDLGKLLWATEVRMGGYQCGGHAELARKIYNLFDFEAFTINFGFRGTPSTHLTTFVRILRENQPVWTIQDTYFNFTLRTLDGSLMGYSQLLQHLIDDEIDSIVIDDPELPKTSVLYSDVAEVPRRNRRYQLQAECIRPWDGFEEFSVRWGFRLMFTSLFNFDQQLNARIKRSHPLYFFLVPIGFRGHKDHEKFVDLAKQQQGVLLRRVGSTPNDLTKTLTLPPKELEPI